MHHEFYHLSKKIIQNYSENKLAMATVFHVRGSAYRREGTRMLIETSGKWHGNISGGCLEGDILRKAQQVIDNKESILVTYDTRESENKEIRVALGCNGIIDILIEPVQNSMLEMCQKVIDLFENEKTAFLTTQIHLIKKKINIVRKLSLNQPKDFPDEAFDSENFCRVEKSEFKITLHEYIGLQRKIVIWGAGPDVRPLAKFSSQLGWKTVVISDNKRQMETINISNVVVKHSYPDNFLAQTELNKNTAVVLVSHDYYKDYFILEKIIKKDVKYIGIMGPKRRGAKMLEELRENHQEIEMKEDKILYPVGLDIGADNPTEIALSIVAEIQSVFTGKNGAPLKEKKSRIHDTTIDEEIEEFNPNDSVCAVNYFQ